MFLQNLILGINVFHRNFEIPGNTVSRLGSKLKGAIRGAIDGAPLEVAETPTVWDAFSDEAQVLMTFS